MPDVFRVADMSPRQLRASIQTSVFIANFATLIVSVAIGVGLYVLTH